MNNRHCWPNCLRFAASISFAICMCLGLSGAIPVSGGEIPSRFDIRGTVVDITQDLSLDRLTALDASKSREDFLQALRRAIRSERPATNVVLTIQGASDKQTTVTDAAGQYKFIGLHYGEHQISVSPSGMGDVSFRHPVFVNANRTNVTLIVHSNLVAIRGRITDVHGKPIAGAKVRGEPDPWEVAEVGRHYPSRVAVSGADGSYELKGLVPRDILSIAGYLAGGDPTENGQYPFSVLIYVKADGFVQEKAQRPCVPLVTEELVGPARRLLNVMWQVKLKSLGDQERKVEEKKKINWRALPSSQGNTITGIDIVLKKAGEGPP